MSKSLTFSNFLQLFILTILFWGCAEKEVEPIAVAAITLDTTSMELVEDESKSLTATISPSNANNKKILWTSSNTSVASVKDGVVTAVKAGKAIIIAKSDDGGKTATCEVTVNSKIISVVSVTLNKTSYEMTEGDEFALIATVNPSNATNKNVTWKSSNTSVATVTNGKVTALKAGFTIITVTTEDGGKNATCEVTVNAKVYPVESVSLDETFIELTEGDEKTLIATVLPDNATNKNVTWTSSNTTVATVSNGKITALQAGSTIITVTTEDGGKSATCEVTVNAKVYPVESVSLDETFIELFEGDKRTLTATVLPDNATNKNIIWTSSDISIACVENGTITAIKAGRITVTATTEDGAKTAICEINILPAINYIDEYGVNHGTGVIINGVIWAPVNCGFHAEDYKYGKLFQWGRKYGQGYEDGDEWDATSPTLCSGGVSVTEANDLNNEDNFYMGQNRYYKDWVSTQDDKLWNSGTESEPIKTENDPCPDGWRVPTSVELETLKSLNKESIDSEISGVSFTNHITGSQVFFPSAGTRGTLGATMQRRTAGYYWSSSPANNKAYSLWILTLSTYFEMTERNRASGCSVRCVQQ